MTHDAGAHRVIAARMRELRRKRDWTAQRLAEEMARVGIPWKREIVANLESGRRTAVSVEELLALAYVLSVAPVHLIVPTDVDDQGLYQVTPTWTRSRTTDVREWIRGNATIGDTDPRTYFSEVPANEFGPGGPFGKRTEEQERLAALADQVEVDPPEEARDGR